MYYDSVICLVVISQGFQKSVKSQENLRTDEIR